MFKHRWFYWLWLVALCLLLGLIDAFRSYNGNELNFATFPDAAGGVATTFQIDQGQAERIAHGVITLDRQGEALRLRWRPKAPDWATTRVLETTIRLTNVAHTSGYTIESAQFLDDRR